MIDPQYLKFLEQNEYHYVRDLGDGRWAAIYQFAFTTAIIVGKVGDTTGYDDRWCYESAIAAWTNLQIWNGTGEPNGWHRHPSSGRRRHDGMEEYVHY